MVPSFLGVVLCGGDGALHGASPVPCADSPVAVPRAYKTGLFLTYFPASACWGSGVSQTTMSGILESEDRWALTAHSRELVFPSLIRFSAAPERKVRGTTFTAVSVGKLRPKPDKRAGRINTSA